MAKKPTLEQLADNVRRARRARPAAGQQLGYTGAKVPPATPQFIADSAGDAAR